MKAFVELGGLVEERWRDRNYDQASFSEIASEALLEANLIERINPWEIIRWVHTTPDLPRQHDPEGKFGNPPITLFAGARFCIDVYFWLDSTTAIHQHGFSGAFQVLLGSSVHSRYCFNKDREINPHFLIGKVLLKEVSLLTKGNIKRIRSGAGFIHSLFHLERPSATITVRSKLDPHDAIQYLYLKPYLAIDPFFAEDSLRRKVQTVCLLLSMRHPEADRFIGDLLDAADFQTTFAVLDAAFGVLGNNELERLFQISKSFERFRAMIARARLRHGEVADLLLPVFEEKRREADICRRRSVIQSEDHRFFLALLLNVPERTMVLDLIRQRFPHADPVDSALSWISDLATRKVFGSSEPNVIGLPGFDLSHTIVFEGLLRGLSDDVIRASHPELPVGSIIERIRTLPMFSSIFPRYDERN
jgi:hypothetical protein